VDPSPSADSTGGNLPADFEDALARVRGRCGEIGSRVLFFRTVSSTNDVGAMLAAAGNQHGAIVVADEQTAGRGRLGRAWCSPPGSGLYVSMLLAPRRARVKPERARLLLTLAAGVALSQAIEVCTGLPVDIKWPNDLLVGRRKLAGILAEAVEAGTATEAVVLGYGINVTPTAYPPDLVDRATSLELELGRSVDRPTLFAETIAAVAERYDDLLTGRFDAILDAWRTRSPGSRGARVEWVTPAGVQEGVTDGIDDQGALLVRTVDRLERVVAGGLSWL
jgi:BirA family transcriptional regulator, biotin operon repressor / biotin---[acetyl-CoA-carboxylase] ligase